MPTDITFSMLERELHELSTRVAAIEKTSSWRHQFSATALPVMITILIGVWAQVSTQNAHFVSLEARTGALEADHKQLIVAVAEVRKDVGVLKEEVSGVKQDVGGLKQEVAGLKQDVAGLKQDVAVLKQDVTGLKQDVAVLKQDVAVLKQDVAELKQGFAGMKQEMLDIKRLIVERLPKKS